MLAATLRAQAKLKNIPGRMHGPFVHPPRIFAKAFHDLPAGMSRRMEKARSWHK